MENKLELELEKKDKHFLIFFFLPLVYIGPILVTVFSPKMQGGRTRLPKFKFSAKFPIGLHVILQIQIRKFENDCYIM